FPPPRPVEEQPACFVEPRNAITRLRSRTGGQQTRSRRPFPFQDAQAAQPPCQLFCVLLRRIKQQWAELYCTDVGAGVKKDSGPYTFVDHTARSQRTIASCQSFCGSRKPDVIEPEISKSAISRSRTCLAICSCRSSRAFRLASAKVAAASLVNNG